MSLECAFFFLVSLLVSASGATAKSSGSETTSHWPRDAKVICENRLFGTPETWFDPAIHRRMVAVRLLDTCELDRLVILTQDSDGKTEIRATTSLEKSIGSQLLHLREAYPDMSLEEACRRVETRSATPRLGPEELTDLLNALRMIKIQAAIESPLIIHGTFYEVWISSAPANHSHFRFQGLPGTETAKDNPLQQWADSVVGKAGLSCTKP